MPLTVFDRNQHCFCIDLDASVSVGTPQESAEEMQYQTVAQAIWLSGQVSPPALCSGLGRCGACRVRFRAKAPEANATEFTILGEPAISEGWRLSCRHAPEDGMVMELPSVSTKKPHTAIHLSHTAPSEFATPAKNCLAVDLGTTSIHWRFLQQSIAGDWKIPDSGQSLNPQMGAGSDVVSRIALAVKPGGRAKLRSVLLPFLRHLIETSPHPVTEMCIAGNTAMTAILLDADCTGLTAAPYHSPESGGRSVVLADGADSFLPPIWIPPQPAPFVGGDISAGMAMFLYDRQISFPFLLADLGTNGEMVLCLDSENALVTSIPLGPSLEGIGLSCGGIADMGSIDAFQLSPTGLIPSVIGGGEPQSVCATGYLSLLSILLKTGALDASGRLASISPHPLARKLIASLSHHPDGWHLPLAPSIWLSAADVEEILKVKAAFSLALESLLTAANLASRELSQVILGGSLGEHAPLDALETLGFLPHGSAARTHAAGNTSLNGAALLLQWPQYRSPLIRWSRQCRLIELASSADFTSRYIRHMAFLSSL